MNNKKITELLLLSTPSLNGVTVVVQNGITSNFVAKFFRLTY